MTVYNGTCGTNLTWTLDTDTGLLDIEGSGAMTDYNYGTSPIYEGGLQSYVTSINLPNGITHLGNYFLRGCNKLNSLYIPDSVTTIGEGLCYGGFILQSLSISSNIESIGKSAFYPAKCPLVTFRGKQPTSIGNTAFRFSGGTPSYFSSKMYSTGWASNTIFTTTITGSETHFTYYSYVPPTPTVPVNIAGTWHDGTPYVNVNGTWKGVSAAYVNVDGTWKGLRRSRPLAARGSI